MKELLNLGLNKLEAQTYLALQELGEAKVGAICKKLDLPNSHMYQTLHSLQEKGLVSHKLANKVKIFQATPPENLKELFHQKQEELQNQETELLSLIDTLKHLPKNKETDSDYQYFQGLKGVKHMIRQVYAEAPEHSKMYLISAVSDSWETLNAFFLDMHKVRIEKNIALQMIMQKQTSELQKRIAERKQLGLVDIRLQNFSTNSELFLTQDYLVILDTSLSSKNPCGFMIKNKVFLTLFKQLFTCVWQNSKEM